MSRAVTYDEKHGKNPKESDKCDKCFQETKESIKK